MTQPDTVHQNIDSIIALEEGQSRSRTLSDRIADAIGSFAGTVVFVVLHLAWFALWAAANLGLLGLKPFDPYPFQLLCMLVSLEGVLLSTFVLIRQNRMSTRADRRAHLDLQINLLAEKEISKLIELTERLSRRLDIPVDEEARQMAQTTAVTDLAQELDQKLPDET